jgi:hypothetical protein
VSAPPPVTDCTGAGPPPSASPAAFTAADILAGLKAYLGAYFGSNQLASAPGGGVENVGVSRAVTEMLLGSGVLVPALDGDGTAAGAQWVTRLFPVWPANESAAFSGLVAKGGLAVSATYDGSTASIASPVLITAAFAAAGDFANATLRSPWPTAPASDISVSCGGSAAHMEWLTVQEGPAAVPALSFLAPAGASCSVALAP